MEITDELLEKIAIRAEEYATARYGSHPTYIRINPDGSLCAGWEYYRCGDRESEEYYIYASDLRKDLETAAAERKAAEDKARAKREQEQRERADAELKAKVAREKAELSRLLKIYGPQS